MRDKFIQYCASVIGLEVVPDSMLHIVRTKAPNGVRILIPDFWNDLNPMAEVVVILMGLEKDFGAFPDKEKLFDVGIKQAFRDFIISTMPESTRGKE